PDYYRLLGEEITHVFINYDITSGALFALLYLHACLEESLSLLPATSTGLPCLGLGVMIDGNYIPKGLAVQMSIFMQDQSPRYFRDTNQYCPER
ncbi:hypothetical protein B0O99DRAFT_725457, partial [Bisporella sp. PMI_857]